MPSEITDATKELLIELVRHQECIWNQRHADHCKTNATENCWRRIAETMRFPVAELKKTWKSIRDGYRIQLNKIEKKKKSGAPAVHCVSNWAFFRQMSFLKDQFAFRESSENDDTIWKSDNLSIPGTLSQDIRTSTEVYDVENMETTCNESRSSSNFSAEFAENGGFESLPGPSVKLKIRQRPIKRLKMDSSDQIIEQTEKISSIREPLEPVSLETDLAGTLCRKFSKEMEKLPFEAQICMYPEITAIIDKYKKEYNV
uniref:MADF domain-containing protein n=1 Tax=Romanomermis culicivorax TaxID=13658 RepID=A0A915JHT9_ROMCU